MVTPTKERFRGLNQTIWRIAQSTRRCRRLKTIPHPQNKMADRQKLSKMLSVSCLTTLSLDFRKSKWPAHVSEIFQHGGSLKSSQRRRLVTRIQAALDEYLLDSPPISKISGPSTFSRPLDIKDDALQTFLRPSHSNSGCFGRVPTGFPANIQDFRPFNVFTSFGYHEE